MPTGIRSKTRYYGADLDFRSLRMAAGVTADGLLPRLAVRSIEDVKGVGTDNHAQFDFTTGSVTAPPAVSRWQSA